MPLRTDSYRVVDVDRSNLTFGDILVVQFSQGESIKLLPVRHECSLRWLYAKATWLPGDTEHVEQLMKQRSSITAFDGYGTIDNGSVQIFMSASWFRLDQPLSCEVEISWEDDTKGRSRSRSLGRFASTGGDIVGVTPTVISRS